MPPIGRTVGTGCRVASGVCDGGEWVAGVGGLRRWLRPVSRLKIRVERRGLGHIRVFLWRYLGKLLIRDDDAPQPPLLVRILYENLRQRAVTDYALDVGPVFRELKLRLFVASGFGFHKLRLSEDNSEDTGVVYV